MEARKIDDIKALLVESKERVIDLWNELQTSVLTDPQLAQLNSTSQTALWRLWAFIVAVNMWVHERLWGIFKSEVEAIAAKSIAGTPTWYRDMCLKFQYGYPLQFINYAPSYSVFDATAQIVTQAAIIEGSYGVLLIKVAKGNVGALMPLSAAEELAFEAFIHQIKFAGTIVQVQSIPADKMKIDATVHYDGVYNILELKQAVEAAIITYLQELRFDGLFYRTKLVDAIQAVAGVRDVEINAITASQGTGNVQTITRNYQTIAGYIEIDSATPLASTVTYSPLP